MDFDVFLPKIRFALEIKTGANDAIGKDQHCHDAHGPETRSKLLVGNFSDLVGGVIGMLMF